METKEPYPMCDSHRHCAFDTCMRMVGTKSGKWIVVKMFPRTCVCEQCGHIYPAHPTEDQWRECANRTEEILEEIDKRKGTA